MPLSLSHLLEQAQTVQGEKRRLHQRIDGAYISKLALQPYAIESEQTAKHCQRGRYGPRNQPNGARCVGIGTTRFVSVAISPMMRCFNDAGGSSDAAVKAR